MEQHYPFSIDDFVKTFKELSLIIRDMNDPNLGIETKISYIDRLVDLFGGDRGGLWLPEINEFAGCGIEKSKMKKMVHQHLEFNTHTIGDSLNPKAIIFPVHYKDEMDIHTIYLYIESDSSLCSTYPYIVDFLQDQLPNIIKAPLKTLKDEYGNLNKSAFNILFPRFLTTNINKRRNFALLIADLDHFKSINDIYGHPVGDKVIQLFSDISNTLISNYVKDQRDTFYRVGGEEFAITIHSLNKKTLEQLLKDICSSLKEKSKDLDLYYMQFTPRVDGIPITSKTYNQLDDNAKKKITEDYENLDKNPDYIVTRRVNKENIESDEFLTKYSKQRVITVSIGAVLYTPPKEESVLDDLENRLSTTKIREKTGDVRTDLYNLVDDVLYHVKNNGRDSYHIFQL